jgi:predicted glycoside hydrolase/deacetylase ChbG (UPF0249 family)
VSPDRVLIVSADDFGLTPGICSGILRAHAEGVVTSTSVLALGPALPSWTGALRDSGLDAGAHLAVVGSDPPLLSRSEIPTLVDRQGRLPATWHAFLRRAATGRIDPADLRREFQAQLDAITAAGIRVTHVDCHQNLQLWPQVRTAAFDIARSVGIAAVRLVESRRWGPRAIGVRALAPSFVRRAAAAGFLHPGASAGFDEAGRVDGAAFAGALADLAATPATVVEISTHPGESHDPPRSAYGWSYRWPVELDVLCDPATRSAVDRAGFRLGSYADLAG